MNRVNTIIYLKFCILKSNSDDIKIKVDQKNQISFKKLVACKMPYGMLIIK